jgi:hypothetical protein
MLISITQLFAEEETRKISKSFNIRADTEIEVSNKFGNVIINRWDKNVLDLKVKIEARGKSASKTQEILDEIEIDISDRISSGSLTIETEIGNIRSNSSFSIHYEITMPDTNPLSLSNSFGNVFMGSYKGKLNVEVKHGQFQAEDLDEANIHISFSYARCEIESLKSGKLDLGHSKMMVEDMGDVEITTQFSELDIENAGSISLDAKHGKFEIENIKSFQGDIQFAGLNIENLEESIILETSHGNGIYIEKVSRGFKKIEIDGEFSSIDITLESGATARLNFDLQFGNLKVHGDGINFNKVIKDHTTSEYEGYLGKQDAVSSIRVRTKHGNIRLDVE